ncbi:MAG TPA: class I SAM-dependent methyltransferase [Chondromyces sp.]|nr:class I SAM-dependent methyltransferase [Chondromyces sp.]
MEKSGWSKQAKEKWNDRAAYWHANSVDMWDNGSRKDIVPFFQQYVEGRKKVCDLGCGDGYGAYKLAKAGYNVTGVDLSEKMIEIAKENENANLHFIQGDLSSLPFDSGEFDAALAVNSLEWTESPLKVLNEIKRVVKKNGYACIAILGPTAAPRTNSYPRLIGEKVIMNTMMPWEFQKLAEDNGWKAVDQLHVYKREAKNGLVESLPDPLKQSLTFLTAFMLERQS